MKACYVRGRKTPWSEQVVFLSPYDPPPFRNAAKGVSPLETPEPRFSKGVLLVRNRMSLSLGIGCPSRPIRDLSIARYETLVSPDTRPSHRAVQDLSTERYETLR